MRKLTDGVQARGIFFVLKRVGTAFLIIRETDTLEADSLRVEDVAKRAGRSEHSEQPNKKTNVVRRTGD